ncbi:related to NACHT domain protein [Ramularia collo-cygni]|uniref:Related to NACHT domain protein n=1 Tax=Ramularia collo-cygni TaxID=112498 RepID=A0A2D3VKG5_9PEZI|nr:related to NACHT domain protein [Ramularia collo-cygni]CZT25011.1 related to NACHT domain protein [Ramularia collo-cygni]
MQRLSSSALMRNSFTNGQGNGFQNAPESTASYFGGSTHTRIRSSNFSNLRGKGSSAEKTTVVRDTAMALKRKSASALGAGISDTADSIGFVNLVEWIRTERLQTLPHKGSKWDTVLIRALYFAERLHGFETALTNHALDVEPASQLGYGHVRLLLELGHENSDALDKAFGLLYRCSTAVTGLLARAEALSLPSDINEQFCYLYTDLLTLVVDVAVRFYKTVHSSANQSASLDLYEAFADTIDSFKRRRETVTNSIWTNQIASSGSAELEAFDVEELARWLSPQDRVLTTLALDYTLIADDMAEFTCIWFHDNLARFCKSEDKTILINGAPGSGKTTLAAALAERLQRPVARKSYATAFCSAGAVPSQATTLHVVKSLLHQLLSTRVGNLHLWKAVTNAYEHSKHTADPSKYEDLLWAALEDTLRNPHAQGSDTVLIVEGLDELVEGQSGQTLLQRLIHAVDQGKGVKLIGLANNLSLPAGSKGVTQTITAAETREDIHEVAIKTLAKSHHFRTQTGREQETIISKIIEAAKGSFLWATLTCETLRMEKTPDGFNKTITNLNSSKTTIEELVQKIVTSLEPNEDAKMLLSWLVNIARPLTYDEIENLFVMNVQTVTRAERRVNVHSIVQSISPLLIIQEGIVRIRHNLVQTATRTLLKQNKVTLSIKDQPMDLLLRLLTYAKVSLPEKGEPTLDDSDRTPIDQYFSKLPLLEYVVRYYTWHLQQIFPAAQGKPSDVKVTPELQKVFPDSVDLAVLEWLCWDDQFPGSQEVALHDFVGGLRAKILGEQQPAVLQSYLNSAAYYYFMEDVPKASSLYYSVTTIGQNVLGVSHPIVVESAIRFLAISENSVTTTRSEIMTHREAILKTLINAYERQYGTTSELVSHTRERLVDLYGYLNERDHAEEILRLIQGGNNDENITRKLERNAADGTLRVTLGQRKTGDLETYKDGIFTDDADEEDAMQTLDLAQVEIIRREIDTYIAQKDLIKAEQTYVDLWQRLSERCRTTLNVEWHQQKIEVVQAYSKFLETQSRRTEATSVLVSIATEYRHHELAFAEGIVTRLADCARFLKSVGEYTAALAIFNHAASYYRNVKSGDSKAFSQIEEEMMVVSNQALTQNSAKGTSTTATTETSHDMFRMLVKSKTFEASTMTLAKQLVSQFMGQKQWSQAISIIEQTLSRSWSSFLSNTVNEVTLATEYQKESIELVEKLAQCYIQERQWIKAEDVYVRFFRAALSSPKDQALLEKAKTLLIDFYTTRGHPHKIIAVNQELLAVYRRILGPNHETTIATLYDLASRCRTHARSHPYWIEYYQNILTVLNKDATTCHPRAFDAALIVAESYWEERRYSDAVGTYSILWQTFITKSKDFRVFSEEVFARKLYDRYFSSLEETQAAFEVLHETTSQYRATAKSLFGADSAVFIEATIALARLSAQSEKHSEQALSLYEEALSSSSKSKSGSSSIDMASMRQTMTSLYRRRIVHGNANVSSETISRAVSMYHDHLAESKSKHGYCHESTLTSLRELVLLYIRQQKHDLALNELTTAVVEVATKETSSQKQYEAATSLVQTYQVAGLTQQCTQLVEELHYQLIACQKSSKATFSVVESGKSSLFFLASMEFHTRKDLTITLSEVMAAVTAEYIYYGNFRQLVSTKASLDKILIAAAPLRHLLRRWNRTGLIGTVDHEAVRIFTEREASSVQLLSKDSPRQFIVGILDYLGNRKTIDFVRIVIIASNKTLGRLIANNQFNEAHDVAKMSFMYAQHRKGFAGPKAIGRGFELASYLDGRGENRCPDEKLRKTLLQLSNSIIKDILRICKEQNINLAQIQLKELNELIALLGEQEDYDTLESLLNQLWGTREAQRSWPPEVLLNLGQRLICARYLAGHQIKALRLADDVSYNLRRVNGVRHPATLDSYKLLAQLYTSTGLAYQKEAASDKAAGGLAADHFKKAILVHEDVLRWLLSDSADGASVGDDEEEDTAVSILAEHGVDVTKQGGVDAIDDTKRGELVKQHLHLLRLAYQRLGSWPKSFDAYERLNAELFRVFAEQLKGVEGVEKWSAKGFGAGKAESHEGTFQGTRNWEILVV